MAIRKITGLATAAAALLASTSNATFTNTTNATTSWTDWRTFKANGVNLGGWLEQELGMSQEWWYQHSTAADEWNFCLELGEQCGPVLEERYASFITQDDIDKFATVGVNMLRIPVTYAAFIDLKWSAFYHGNQTQHLKRITDYAIEQHGMKIVLGFHSLPGGVNGLDIGEAAGHMYWFNNQSNLDASLQAVSNMLDWIINESGHKESFTISPINEAIDNLSGLGQSTALTTNGSAWVNHYFQKVVPLISAVEPSIPIALQDSWKGEAYWSPYLNESANIVIDTHIYYNYSLSNPSNVTTIACERALTVAGDGKFPIFVGEWAIQTHSDNQFSKRKEIFDTQRYAWSHYNISGSSYWSGRHNGNSSVDGEGLTMDYWNYETLIDAGVVTTPSDNGTAFC